jgi:predicted nucleic acid-binding protein
MPTNDDQPDVLVDTSVAVALLVADHEGHESTFEALGDRRLGLAGHAAFETFSVLTRLPPPVRRSPAGAARLLTHNFPHRCFLSQPAAEELFRRLPSLGIAGDAVYDALVGAIAKEHAIPLATRDARALGTYRALDVETELISPL